MKKIIVQEMVTVDGFFAGPNGEIDWHNVDDEFNEYAIGMLDEMDTLIFGRVTYDLMAGFWPTEHALKDSPIVAGRMNSLRKLVFSKTAGAVPAQSLWNNTVMVGEIDPDKIRKMKGESGEHRDQDPAPDKNMVIMGSSTIVSAFADLGLIDEYRLIVNPVVLGNGKLLFAGIEKKFNLKLASTRQFKSGNVLLVYQPSN